MSKDEEPKLSLVREPATGEIMQSRADEAYERKMAGQSLTDIAGELGYNSGAEVAQAIRQRMRSEAKFLDEDDRDGILALELARLDKLQFAVWPSAVYGDPKAVDLVLKIMTLRMRVTGVDQPDASAGKHTVLVIGGNEESYVQALKEASDESDD